MKTLTEDEFWAQYKPVKNRITEDAPFDGCMFETYGQDMIHVLEVHEVYPHFIWTIIDTDNGLSITSGYHYVNRLGYLITELPADEDFIDVILETINDEEE